MHNATVVNTDVIVVGAGPAGSTVARYLARYGIDVLIVDKRQELGAPIQCSGAISRHALVSNDVEPQAEFIHEAIYGFRILDGDGGDKRIDYRQIKPKEYGQKEGRIPLGYVVDRRRFDRHLLTLAERAGARAWLKAEALGMKYVDDGISVAVNYLGEKKDVRAKLIVGADGLRSQVGKWANISTHIKLRELASCLQIIVDGVETEGLLELVTGSATAPGGYGWVFPKGHGYAEVGLGIITPYTKKNAKWYLDQFMNDSFLSHRFKNARILEIQGGGVPLAAPLKRQYDDNLILVGDAARHVNPITGGGLHTALTGGMVAGRFLVQHLNSGHDHNKMYMAGYQDMWMEEIGHQMWQLYKVKKEIFGEKNIDIQDKKLFTTMGEYFSPDSPYKKV